MSSIISEALDISASQSVDGWLFSTNAASAIAPPGVLNGLSALTSAGGQGAAGMAQDIAKLTETISQAGIDTSDLTFFCDAGSAAKVEILASPKFTERVFPSTQIASGTVICVAARGFYTGFGAVPIQVEVNREALLHYESATPLAIVDSSGTVASPTTSLFQQDYLAINVRAQCTWIVHPGSVCFMTGCAW